MKDNLPKNKDLKDLLDKEDLDNYNNFEYIKNEFAKGKREFMYKNGKVFISGNKFIYVLKEKKIYYSMNSKIIYFTNKKLKLKTKAYFIHDTNSFQKALKKEKIDNGVLKSEEKVTKQEKNIDSDNSNKSDSSDISVNGLKINDILNSSYNNVEEPKLIKVKKIFTNDNFNKKLNYEKISDLDFNFKYLNEDYTSNNIEYQESQNNWYKQLEEFYFNNEKSYCFLFGPKGTGKTTALLKYLNLEEIPRLYFSLKLMLRSDFNLKKWKKISLYETIYTFSNINEMNLFSEYDLNKISKSSNLMEFIFSYIKFVINFYSTKKIENKKIFVILDDYNDSYDKNNIIEEIINYANENKDKLFLCISGNGGFINTNLYLYLSNKNYNFFGVYCNLLIENKDIKSNEIFKLPKYYYKYIYLKNKNGNENITKKEINDNTVEKKLIIPLIKCQLMMIFPKMKSKKIP